MPTPFEQTRFATARRSPSRPRGLSLVFALVLAAAGSTAAPASASSPSASSPSVSSANEPSAPVVRKQAKSLRVFGTDDRQPVGDTTIFPWSAIGLVEAVWYRGDFMIVSTATGALVGNRVVLTSAHAIYDLEDGWADQVVFVPGKNGDAEPFGRAYSIRNIAQRAWVEEGDNRFDLGLIVLDKPLGEQAGFMSIAVESETFFVNRDLNSAGYPGEIKPGDRPYHVFGTVTDLRSGLIRHFLDSEPGQSGSPLWYLDAQTSQRRIVGVLTGTREVTLAGELVDAYNVAVHINTAFAGWIQDTLLRHDTVVQDIAVGESSPSLAPACGVGLPGAFAALLLGLHTVRRAARRP